jgi:hypothetical protein
VNPFSKLVAVITAPKAAVRPAPHQERAAAERLYPTSRRNVRAVQQMIGPSVHSAHTHGDDGSSERP